MAQATKEEQMALVGQLVFNLGSSGLEEKALLELSKLFHMRPCPLQISTSLEERNGFSKYQVKFLVVNFGM